MKFVEPARPEPGKKFARPRICLSPTGSKRSAHAGMKRREGRELSRGAIVIFHTSLHFTIRVKSP